MDRVNALLALLRQVLQGEPLRAIVYGGAVVVYLVARAFGRIPDVSLDQALIQAGSAAALLVTFVETTRRFVFSGNTVAVIAAGAPVSSGEGVTPDDSVGAV